MGSLLAVKQPNHVCLCPNNCTAQLFNEGNINEFDGEGALATLLQFIWSNYKHQVPILICQCCNIKIYRYQLSQNSSIICYFRLPI